MIRQSQEVRRMWRQLAALSLAFALTLQGLTLAFAAARAVVVSTGHDRAGIQLCLHNASGDEDGSTQPVVPPSGSLADHCVFCFAGASFLLGTQEPAPQFYTIVLVIEPWTFAAWRLPPRNIDANTRPRGPPQPA